MMPRVTPLPDFFADVVAVAAEAAAVQGDHLLHQEGRAQIDARSSKQQARPEHAGRAMPTRSGGARTPHLDAGARAFPAHPNSHALGHAALLLIRCTRSLLTSPRSPPQPSARQPPPSCTCWVGSTRAATALRTSGLPWTRAPRGESSRPRHVSFPPCRRPLAHRPWQHWLAWRALCMDVRSPQPRQPPTGQGRVLLRALAAGHALVWRSRPTRTCCCETADTVPPRCWTGATEASDVAVKRSSRTFPAPGSSRPMSRIKPSQLV